MKKLFTRAYTAVIALILVLSFTGMAALGGCASAPNTDSATAASNASISASATSSSSTIAKNAKGASGVISVDENSSYSDKESVALYIHTYGHLPPNYISKTKARKAGWESEKGNLWDVLPGKSIGGSEFYNDDETLPDAAGRRWTECDIGYEGGFRGAERIVFSNDGLIYYTGDHYKTFERLY